MAFENGSRKFLFLPKNTLHPHGGKCICPQAYAQDINRLMHSCLVIHRLIHLLIQARKLYTGKGLCTGGHTGYTLVCQRSVELIELVEF